MSQAENKPVVAIAGATGNLGQHLARAFQLPEFRSNFSNVILLTRNVANLPAEQSKWQQEGTVTVRTYSHDTLKEALADADVVVNVIGSAGHALRQQIIQALDPNKVKIYFPSEFGVDHTVHDFKHSEWNKKKQHFEDARKLLPNTKICRVFAGLFIEDSIGPWFGFNTREGRYEAIGSSKAEVSFTSLDDVGKAVAQAASMSPDKVPAQLHISGDTESISQIAEIMGRESDSDIQITELDLQAFKEKELENPRPDPSGCLRFLMGEGNINHSTQGLGCDNELVNPGQKYWRWKTLSDLAKETGGKPWADVTWPPAT